MLTFSRLSNAAYRKAGFDLLLTLEGSTKRAYLDTAANPAPTIGIGFNQEVAIRGVDSAGCPALTESDHCPIVIAITLQ